MAGEIANKMEDQPSGRKRLLSSSRGSLPKPFGLLKPLQKRSFEGLQGDASEAEHYLVGSGENVTLA